MAIARSYWLLTVEETVETVEIIYVPNDDVPVVGSGLSVEGPYFFIEAKRIAIKRELNKERLDKDLILKLACLGCEDVTSLSTTFEDAS